MTDETKMSGQQLDRVRATAAVLLPGSTESPAPHLLPEFDELLQQAAVALGGEGRALAAAIETLPPKPSWENLSALSECDPSSFELVSLLAIGAYFMSPTVLGSMGIPTGKRRPANPEQVVDELSDGILDPVFERGCPVRTLEEVDGQRVDWVKE